MLLLAVFWCLSALQARAQTWNATLNLNPTPSPYISDWENNPTAVGQATIMNNGSSGRDVVLFVTLFKSDAGLLVEAESPTLFIGAMETRVLNNTDYIEFSSANYRNTGIKNRAFRTGRLPAGSYTGCIQVRTPGGANLSSRVCQDFEIVYPDPPQLIYPDNGAEVTSEFPTFQWIPVNVPADYDVFYTMKLVEILEGQAPLRALDANVPVLERSDIGTSTFNYPLDAFALEEGGNYAWQIQALDQFGLAPASNQGRSEIFTFQYRPAEEDTVAAEEEEETVVDHTVPSGPCYDSCTIAAPADTDPATRSFSAGDEIRLGKFVITLTELTSTDADNLSGEGTTEIPFFNAQFRVEFTGLQVNAAGEVFSGEARASVEAAAGVPPSELYGAGAEAGLSREQVDDLYEVASQADRLASSFGASDTVSLPIGFDKDLAGRRMVIGVFAMTFRPTTAQVRTGFKFDLPELGPDAGLNFQQQVCFHPNGLGESGAMFLAEDFGYERDESWSFQFKAPVRSGPEAVPSDSGTYVWWDCDGFRELRVKADVEFPRGWFTPDPDDGASPATATFVTRVRDGTGWMATANMDRVRFTGAPGFGMDIENLVFDFSDSENPEGIAFPDTYEGITGPDWKGFYIQTADLILPPKIQTFEGSPPRPSVNNLLIDNSGFTADIVVENVIRGETGDFGGWAGSIEELGLEFVSSSMRDGHMNGGIKLPVSDDELDYEALLHVVHESEGAPESEVGDLEYTFTVTPEEEYTVPMWAAELNLYETTYISLVDTSDVEGFQVEANLNGILALSGELSDATDKIPLVNFEGIEFSELRFMNEDPYYEIGTWSFSSPQHGMGGFPVSIDDIRPVTKLSGGDPSLGLGFDLNINLMGETVSGTAGLAIYGKLNVTGPGPMSAEYDGVELEKIRIDAEIDGAVEIHGLILFYDGDPTYGNGFRGSLEATFLEDITISATAQFGTVDDYRYWYVDARASLGSAGISMGVVSLYGFGGGAWYHMKRSGSGPAGTPAEFASGTAGEESDPGMTNSGYRFVPDRSVDLGVKALVTLGLSGSDAMFNADVELVVTIRDGTLGEIALSGQFFMLAQIPNRDRAILNGAAEFRYVFPDRTFTGVFDINFDLTPFDVSIQMDLLFSPEDWHVKIGDPYGEIASADFGFADLSVNAYFMTGTDIPGIPDPPSFFGVSQYSVGEYAPERKPGVSNGKGFAFGANASLDTGDLTFLIFFARLRGEIGFDFSLMKQTEGCNNWREVGLQAGEPPGWSGWYGQGQVYAYVMLKAGVKIKLIRTRTITLISAELGALMQGKGPKPTWMMGMLKGKFTVLKVIKVSFRFKAEIGNECELPERHPLDQLGLEIISDIEPADASEDVDVYAEPQVAFNLPVGESAERIRFEEIDEETGEIDVRYFRALLHEFTITREDRTAALPLSRLHRTDDGYEATLYPRDLLAGETEHEVRVEVAVEEYIDGEWETSRDPRTGEVYTQSKTATFETGPFPDVIEDRNVAYTYPIKRQRFFLQDERSMGRIVLKRGFPDIESNPFNATSDQPNHQMIFAARFIPIEGGEGESDRNEVNYNSSARSVNFELPRLENETIYSVQIVRLEVDTSGSGGLLSESRGLGELTGGISEHEDMSRATIRERLAYAREGVTVTQKTRELPGIQVRSDEKLLHQFFFRTSRYNTFSEKMSDVELSEVDGGRLGMFQSNTLHFRSEEGFDEFDLHGYRFRRDGLRQRFGPLVQVTAKDRSTFWHRFFADLQLYNRIDWLQGLGPLPPRRHFFNNVRMGELRGRQINFLIRNYFWSKLPNKWNWSGITRWERADRRNTLAEYTGEGRYPLSDAEVRRAGTPEPSSATTGSSTGLSWSATGATTPSYSTSSGGYGIGGTSFSMDASTIDSRYPLDVLHRHGVIVPLDYLRLKRAAGTALYRFADYNVTRWMLFRRFSYRYRLGRSAKYRLQRILRRDYLPIYSEQYSVKFVYMPLVSGTRVARFYLDSATSQRTYNFDYVPN